MKDIYCCKCGEPIQSGYAINPENSAICETCYEEETEKLLPHNQEYMSETYKIHVHCTNCHYESTTPQTMVEIDKGVPIYIHLLNTRCPYCGCKTLIEAGN